MPVSFENSTTEDMVDRSPEAQQPYKGLRKRAMNWCSWKRAVSHPFARPTTATLYCTCRRYANVCVWWGALHPARRHRALHWTRLVPHFILWMPPPGDEGRLGKYVDANCLEWPRTKKKCVAGQSDGEWRTHGRRQNESSAFVPVNAPSASRSVHFLQSGHLSCRGRHVAPPPAANSLGGSSRCFPDRGLVWTSQDQGSDEAVHHVIREKKTGLLFVRGCSQPQWTIVLVSTWDKVVDSSKASSQTRRLMTTWTVGFMVFDGQTIFSWHIRIKDSVVMIGCFVIHHYFCKVRLGYSQGAAIVWLASFLLLPTHCDHKLFHLPGFPGKSSLRS